MKKLLSILVISFLISPNFAQTSLKIGDQAPEIYLKDKTGKFIKLSENMSSLTIVHFWASWSNACKPMNQLLSESYTKYRRDGLEIFSVSIDKKGRNWLAEIENQKLTWPHHVSDFKGMVYSKPAKDYKIYEVPSIFVLNEKGIIVLINPTEDELSRHIKLFESGLKVLPKNSSNFIFLTKRVNYLIYNSEDTLVMGGKGKSVNISSLDTGKYHVNTGGQSFDFNKVIQEEVFDFQINYKTKQIRLSAPCSYEIRNENGNLLITGNSDYIDYSTLEITNKHDFYLVLPNSGHSIKLH
jgi:peroxiredoxin